MELIKIEHIYHGEKTEDYEEPIYTEINDNIKIHYSLFLENGQKIETQYDKIPFYIEELGYSYDCFENTEEENDGTIIKGLDKVITELKLGDFVRVNIPCEYAYGEKGIPLDDKGISYLIPKRTNLIYYIQLIYIERNDNIFEYPNVINLNKLVISDDIDKIKNKMNIYINRNHDDPLIDVKEKKD